MSSHAFLPAGRGYHAFKKIMQLIDHGKEDMLSVSSFIEEEDYVPFNEWLSVSTANYIVGDDK